MANSKSEAHQPGHTFSVVPTPTPLHQLPALTPLCELDDPQVAQSHESRCQGVAKLDYRYRVVSSTAHLPDLHAFDAAQKDTFFHYMGWTTSDSQWAQATRGYRRASLWLRCAAKHAAPAYIASYTATLKHCLGIDPNYQ